MILSHPRFNEAILDGTKDTTVRLNNRYYPGEIHAMMNPGGKEPFAWVRITAVSEKTLDVIDVKREGFAHVDDLRAFLKNAYDMEFAPLHTIWQVIEFERVEAPDEPKVTPDA